MSQTYPMHVTPVRWTLPAWRSAAGTWTARDALIVAITVDGAVGLGEAAPLTGVSIDDVDACARALVRAGAARWPSPEALDTVDGVVELAVRAAEECPGAPAAAWALFCAILDARARAAGVPLAARLAPRPAQGLPVAEVVDGAAAALLAVARGIRTLKVKIGVAATGAANGDVRAAAESIEVIRDAIGPGAAIRVDANGAFAPEAVPALLDRLAPLDVELVEEPAPGYAATLRRPTSPPLALDESLAEPGAERWLDAALGSGAIAALVIKPTILGPARALALAARARAHGIATIVSHALEGPVGMAACAELALALAGGAVGAVAAGLGPHRGLHAWQLEVPTLGATAIAGVPRAGTGLAVAAVQDRARRLEARR